MPPFDLALPAKSPSRVSRSLSISSDRTSQSGYGGLYSPPLNVTPEAGFIAASAASQIVTNDHDSRADTWLDQHGIEPSGETALVAPSALLLLNRFLDQLLFGFLAVSKSTSLVSLRPAVSEVLKTKLAQHAIHGADQELHEYLGGGEDEEILTFHDAADTRDNWDLELVWKRTRLRCMVYSSLGDMEEEDEDYYTEQEQLDGAGSSRFAPGVVSPAVAIFLTSILEYMGEQILVVAGQSAYNRLRTKLEKEEKEGTNTHGDIADRVVVEEFDMERVAMDRTLGRLWRGWKKRVRSPTASVSLPRSFSRDSLQTPISAGGYTDIIEERRPSLAAVLAEFEHAALIPIPASADDIREIEIPGLADQSDDEDGGAETDDEDFSLSLRPKSLIFFDNVESRVPETSESLSPTFLNAITRTRSRSLPSPTRARYNSKHETIIPDTEVEDASPDSLEPEIEILEDQELDVEEVPEVVQNRIQTQIEHTVVAPATEKEIDEEPEINSQGLAGIVAGAVAVGSIAVVGIVAAVKGEAPQTDLVEDDIDVEELNEEAQIMTSSRVSLGGLSPDDASSKSNSIRSQSVHSLRLIDVASPSRSRTGSIDAADSPIGRSSLSRSNSMHSPLEQIIRGTSPISRVSNSSPLARNGSALSTRQLRNGAEDSISEEKEAVYEPVVTPDASDIAGAMQGVDVEPSQVIQPQVEKFQPQKPLSFVLSTPAVRNTRGVSSHTAEEYNGTRTNRASSRSMSSENGAPSLKPLKETMEGAYSTSDESTSISPSKYSKTIPEHGAYGHSPSASGSTVSQNQRDQSRNHRHQPIARSSPPRSSPDESRNFSKIQRSHTSDSSSSGHSHKLKAVRTSEDSAPARSEDKGKSFEQLIRSDQTIQYTLTPQNMRNIESPDSARHAMTPTIVTNGSDSRRPQTSRSHSSSLSKPVQPTQIEPQSPRSNKLSKTVSRASSNATRSRMNAPQARDARVNRESVQDFAEFIRNTGPTNESGGPLRQHRGTNGTPRNVSTSVQRPQTSNTLPRRAESSAGRSRLQARDPVVPRGDSISDLIDFVRSGPQLDRESHRIPRTVAPFRSTMDSDQMVGAVGGKAVDASFPERYSQAPSVNSSVNSQSALLNGPKKPIQHQPSFDEEPVMPKRKTRRVRDPYAIDVSDEDEEYETFSKPKPIKEESLADFLKNVPPPAVSTVTPIFEPEQARNVKKKSSSTSFRSRFSRKEPLPPMPKSNGNDSRASTSRSDAPRAPQHTPIAAQYSTTTTAPTVYEPTRNNYVAQVDSARNRVAQKSYQPRDAAYSARTNDLADFLKSEPPSSTQTQPKPFTPAAQKEEGAFHRMFGRKKIH